MKTLPSLRTRTEFTFRKTFAPIGKVADRLQELQVPAAGIVDPGTWGHVKFSGALSERGVRPLFGTEFVVPNGEFKPTAWALAAETKGFYNFSSAVLREGADIPSLLVERRSALVRFAGDALTDPELFDYVDINPAMGPLAVRRALALQDRTNKPMVITQDNFYSAPEDMGAFGIIGGGERTTPQYILPTEVLRRHFPQLDDFAWDLACRHTFEAADRCASQLPTAPLIDFPGDLRALVLAGKEERLRLGHLKGWDEVYEARMERELDLIALKKFDSYFLVVSDLISWAKQRMLVGPGRGSSAGSLVCYLLRITEVDPIPHGLIFERFIDISRADLPDIDIDFSDSKRDMVFTYLADKYGQDNVARIGSINTLGARSVVSRIVDKLGIPQKEKFDIFNVLITYSSGDSRYGHALEDTMTQTEPGKRFAANYPEALELTGIEGHATHTGIHAAGVIVSNDPVIDYCTVGPDGIAQLDKKDAEVLNLLKIDALGLRTLGVIEDAGVVTADQLYALDLNEPAALAIFNQKRYAGIFQFEGSTQRRVAAEVHVDSFMQIDHVTALARPGPLGGGASQKYIARAAGREEVTMAHPLLAPMLKDTMGVALYQEQVMLIVKEIGGFSWEDTSFIRKAMSGRKGNEYFAKKKLEFIDGAKAKGVPEETANGIWDSLAAFGSWAMNKSHTCSYAVISLWCAWMKAHHPLEYAAACLRNAKDDEQIYELLRDMKAEGVEYTAFDPETADVDWAVVDGKLIGGFMNLVGYGPAKAVAAVEQRRLGKLDLDKVSKAQVKFTELYPLRAAYGAMFDNPQAFGVRAGSRFSLLDNLPERGDVLIICSVTKKELRDENEAVRLARREGKRVEGNSLFLDVFVTDDTGVPLTIRVDRFKFEPLGQRMAEELQVGDHLMVRGRRIPNFAMIKIERIKVLNREVAL